MASEKRLIDANALIAEYDRVHIGEPGKARKLMEDAPTIDAVEVVRCRECKHHRDKNEQEQQYLAEDTLICTSPDATDDCWNAVWPDHFCSYGERNGGAG